MFFCNYDSGTVRTIDKKGTQSYLNDWLYASGFPARYFIVLATVTISSGSFICSTDPGQGAKS